MIEATVTYKDGHIEPLECRTWTEYAHWIDEHAGVIIEVKTKDIHPVKLRQGRSGYDG